jgi:ATP-dependent exoDNAse (exonuclease V) beta subunit
MRADEVLIWLIDAVEFKAHFRNYFGTGEDSLERMGTLDALVSFARQSNTTIIGFLDLVARVDPTRGVPESEQIIFTTVHRTKGLEFDHVIIPMCIEDMMPVLSGAEQLTFDISNPHAEPVSSPAVDNERRLFYVALTRAREQVLIGAADAPRQGAQASSQRPIPSRFLEEIRLRGAEAIAGGLTNCIDQAAVSAYVRAVITEYRRDRSLGRAVENAAKYLSGSGWQRDGERLQRLLTYEPPKPFTYVREYADVSEVRRLKGATPSSSTPSFLVATNPKPPKKDYG